MSGLAGSPQVQAAGRVRLFTAVFLVSSLVFIPSGSACAHALLLGAVREMREVQTNTYVLTCVAYMYSVKKYIRCIQSVPTKKTS